MESSGESYDFRDTPSGRADPDPKTFTEVVPTGFGLSMPKKKQTNFIRKGADFVYVGIAARLLFYV